MWLLNASLGSISNAYAVSVNWLVSLDNEHKFFAGSKVQTKLLELGESVKDVSTQNQGYDGHVVTVVSDRYLVDASFDQAISNLNLHCDLRMKLEPKVLIIGPASEDLPKDSLQSSPETLVSGKSLCVSYEARTDTSFQSTPAWNAPLLDMLSDEIWKEMQGEFAKMGLEGGAKCRREVVDRLGLNTHISHLEFILRKSASWRSDRISAHKSASSADIGLLPTWCATRK